MKYSVSIGDQLRLTKNIYDDGCENHHPPGNIGCIGDLVIVRKLERGGKGGERIYVSHEEILDNCFLVYPSGFHKELAMKTPPIPRESKFFSKEGSFDRFNVDKTHSWTLRYAEQDKGMRFVVSAVAIELWEETLGKAKKTLEGTEFSTTSLEAQTHEKQEAWRAWRDEVKP